MTRVRPRGIGGRGVQATREGTLLPDLAALGFNVEEGTGFPALGEVDASLLDGLAAPADLRGGSKLLK